MFTVSAISYCFNGLTSAKNDFRLGNLPSLDCMYTATRISAAPGVPRGAANVMVADRNTAHSGVAGGGSKY